MDKTMSAGTLDKEIAKSDRDVLYSEWIQRLTAYNANKWKRSTSSMESIRILGSPQRVSPI